MPFEIFKGQSKTLQISLTDAGLALDLTGNTGIELHVGDRLADTTLEINTAMTVVGAPTGGVVKKDFAPADIAAILEKAYFAQVHVNFGTTVYKSPVFIFTIKPAVKA
ncbi:hypothetical protein L0152_07425 [bacterium]|nr:hypothetical protein [bacterium]